MALSEKGAFSFTWKIENFSMCPHLFKKSIDSPTFLAFCKEWKLCLFPRGTQDRNYFAHYLERIQSSDKEEAITIGFEFLLHSVHPKMDVCRKVDEHIFDNNDLAWGFPQSCLRDDILINGFLPNDTLTLECRMRKIDGKVNVSKSAVPTSKDLNLTFSGSSLQKQMRTMAARDEHLDFQTQFASNDYLARSRVRISRKCIIWPIRKFNSLRRDLRLSIPVVMAGTYSPSFAMTLYLSGESDDNQSVQIEIRLQESDITEVCFVRGRITAVHDSKTTQHVADDEHFFEPTKKKDVWKFPTFLQMTSLMEEKYLDATQGTLNLRCEFVFSSEGGVFHIEGSDSVTPFLNLPPEPVKEELYDVHKICKQVYEEGKFSDVTFRTAARTFKAHKSILTAGSPVFGAMFETDMLEKESGVIDITDYDAETVEQLLAFIYTNNVGDLQQEKAAKLYSIADKYEVLSLKLQCSNLLKSTLSVSNVCEVLILADLHQDEHLLDHVQKYIQLNSDVILRSQMWEDLIKSNGSLTSRVMLYLLTRKKIHL